jgi:hypothetical protein
MTIETPKPYCWAVEWTNSLWAWRGENAKELAHRCNPQNQPPPFPLYREPPAHHFANAGKVMPIGTARELLSIAALEILGLKPSTKLYTMPEEHEPPVTEESSAAQPTQDDDLTAVYLAGMQRGKDLALKSKVELNKVYWEGEKLIGVVKAPVGFVGLTHDEVIELIKETWGCDSIAPQKAHSFAYALEVKLKEKNGL